MWSICVHRRSTISPISPIFVFNDIRTNFPLPRVWALRNNVTAYDAVYIALAEGLDAVLLTRDHRLAGAAGDHVRVELV